MAVLITSNEEMEDIIKVVKFLEESGLMTKGAGETIENEVNETKDIPKRWISWYIIRQFIRKFFPVKGVRSTSQKRGLHTGGEITQAGKQKF